MSDPRTLAATAAEAATCTRCRLAEGRTQVVFGTGDPTADLLFLGEGPGADEDAAGLPFVGRSGQLLDRLMADEMAACRPWLEAKLSHIDPKVVVTLGNVASRTLLGRSEGITRLRGRAYPWEGRTVIPTYHPSAALRGTSGALAGMRADLVRAKLTLAGQVVEPQGAP